MAMRARREAMATVRTIRKICTLRMIKERVRAAN